MSNIPSGGLSGPVPASPVLAGSRLLGKHAFITHFMLLSVIGGITIGMAKIATTLFALHIGASAMQVGVISAMESLGMIFVTLPAGFLISKYGAKRVYFLSSMGPMVLTLLMPWMTIWYALAAARLAVGLCIPFRIISMNGSFLQQLKHIGMSKAGWYRAAQSLGMGLLGPLVGNWVIGNSNYTLVFFLVGLLFGIMALYGQQVLPESEAVAETVRPDEHALRSMARQIGELLRSATIAGSCLIEYVSSSTAALFGTFIIVVAINEAGLSQSSAIHLVLLQGATSVITLFGLGRLLYRIPRCYAYAASFLLAVAGLSLIGSSHGFNGLALGGVLLSVGSAMIHMVNMAQMSTHAMDKSKISGLYNLASMLGSFSGAMAGGVLSEYVGLQHVFLVWIPFLGLAVVAHYLLISRREAVVGLTQSGGN